jgi:hypothetical protein
MGPYVRKVPTTIKSIWSFAVPYTRVVGGERRLMASWTVTSDAESDFDGFDTVSVRADDRQCDLPVLSVDIDMKRELASQSVYFLVHTHHSARHWLVALHRWRSEL